MTTTNYEDRNFRQFKMLANSLPQLVFFYDPESKEFWYNQAWVEQIGELPLLLEHWISILDQNESSRIIGHISESFKSGQEIEEIMQLKKRKGVFEHFFANIVPIRSPEGKIENWFGTFNLVQNNVRNNFYSDRERLVLATEAAELGVWEFDILTGASYWSDKTKTIFGFSPQEFTGTLEQIDQRIHPEDRDLVHSAAFRKRDHTGRYSVEFRILLPNGNIRWLMTLGKTYSDTAGNPLKLVGVTMDITSRKLVEADLRSALIMRDDFISIASHELRTPLTPLKLQYNFIKSLIDKNSAEYPKAEMILKLVDSSDQQVDRLLRLIEDMLDVSRIRSGKLKLNLELLNLAEVVRDVSQRFELEMEKANIILNLNLDNHIVGNWDRLRMEQVVVNLLTNAMKYGNKNPITITLEPFVDGSRLIVQDNGMGIAEGDQQRIFNRFERAVSKQHYGGLGLGLYITHQIVDAHGGSIKVVSQPGKGSSFIVELPQLEHDMVVV